MESKLRSASSRRDFFRRAGALSAAAASTVVASESFAQSQDGDKPNRPDRKVTPGSPSKAYSRAVQSGRFVFVAGCVGRYEKDGKPTMDKDFEAQARRTLENLKSSVEASGSSMDRVLKCTCFLKEYADFQKFNEVYMSFFPEPRPARSTVVVKDFVVPGALVEVDCVCAI
jgi:2-iminobutanoate/2-iminopropanoate deaminase